NLLVRDGSALACAIVRDITKRKEAEDELLRSHLMTRAIIDAFPGLINAKDLESRYILMNRRQAELCATSVDAAIGRIANDQIFGAAGEHPDEYHHQIISSGQTVQYEEESQDARGRRHAWLTTKVPLREAARTDDTTGSIIGIVSVSVEITDLK